MTVRFLLYVAGLIASSFMLGVYFQRRLLVSELAKNKAVLDELQAEIKRAESIISQLEK